MDDKADDFRELQCRMKTIVLLSGGLDSATLFYYLRKKGQGEIIPLFFSYGQKSERKEYCAARTLSTNLGFELAERKISNIFANSGSSLLVNNRKSISVEFGQGRERKIENRNTEVEFRNGVFLSAAISLAMQLSTRENCVVSYGAILTHAGFRDCSKIFVQKFDDLAKFVSQGKVMVEAPFVEKGKDEVLKIARELNVPIQQTWSCYLGGDEPCRKCPACFDNIILGVLK